MSTVRKITNEVAIAGQITLDELQQLVEAGYRTIVNLRSPYEPGFLEDEQAKVERLSLTYINIPLQATSLSCDNILPIIQQLLTLPKPMLIHCDNGIRASVIVLMQIAIEQGTNPEVAFQKVKELGLLSNAQKRSQ